MTSSCSISICGLLLAACQQKAPEPPPAPIVVQVTDGAGKVVVGGPPMIDTQGIAQIRIRVVRDQARVLNGASADIRSVSRGTAGSAGPTLVIDKPALTVTGTDDLVLAGLLASPELVPQVRMLAACERVLAKGS